MWGDGTSMIGNRGNISGLTFDYTIIRSSKVYTRTVVLENDIGMANVLPIQVLKSHQLLASTQA